MDMHLAVAYSTRNTVVELEENRRIALAMMPGWTRHQEPPCAKS
jgi:hypothetical protein